MYIGIIHDTIVLDDILAFNYYTCMDQQREKTMTRKDTDNYATAIRSINNSTRGTHISLGEFAQAIQRNISTEGLRDLINELVGLYEPTEEMSGNDWPRSI